MSAKNRLEKHNGVTLMVTEGWLTVVWDATGHEVAGPVDSDADVVRITKIAVDTLREITKV